MSLVLYHAMVTPKTFKGRESSIANIGTNVNIVLDLPRRASKRLARFKTAGHIQKMDVFLPLPIFVPIRTPSSLL